MEFKTWLDGRIKLYNGDCLEFMENMQDNERFVNFLQISFKKLTYKELICC
jgi:DNA modification methylase